MRTLQLMRSTQGGHVINTSIRKESHNVEIIIQASAALSLRVSEPSLAPPPPPPPPPPPLLLLDHQERFGFRSTNMKLGMEKIGPERVKHNRLHKTLGWTGYV